MAANGSALSLLAGREVVIVTSDVGMTIRGASADVAFRLIDTPDV